MAEYINREELIAACQKTHFSVNANDHPFDVVKRVGKYFRRCVDEAPAADVVEVKNGEVLLPITEKELRHLINDTVAYIWRLEEKGLDKEEFGYFSRKELLEKLKRFEKNCEEHSTEQSCNDCVTINECEKATHIENYGIKGCMDFKKKVCTDCRYFVGCECFSGMTCDQYTEVARDK